MDIRILICDDISEHRRTLIEKILTYRKNNNPYYNVIIDEAGKRSEILAEINKNQYDIAFLDIEIDEDIDGVVLCDLIHEINPKTIIVFVSAHTRYTHVAFMKFVSFYVTKPIDDNYFYRVLEKIFVQIDGMRLLGENDYFLEIKVGSKKMRIIGKNILFMEKYGRRVKIYMNNNEIFEPVITLNEIEKKAD